MAQGRGMFRAALVAAIAVVMALASSSALPAAPLALATAAGVTPIPHAGTSTLPAFTGTPGYGRPIGMPLPPQNPFMGANPLNNVHNDSWLTDTAHILGPAGGEVVMRSNRLADARRNPSSTFFTCGTLTFDAVAASSRRAWVPGRTSLVMADPDTLEVLAYSQLPVATGELAGYGSAYMYLDDQDRAMMTVGDHVWVMAQTGGSGAAGFAKVGEYDFSAAVPAGSAIQSVMPDWRGRLWAMIQGAGAVAVLDPATGAVRSVQLKGQITNSFAVDRSSAYVVTTERMYRLDAGRSGQPKDHLVGTVREHRAAQARPEVRRVRHQPHADRRRQVRGHQRQRRPDARRGLSHAPACPAPSPQVCSVRVFPKGRGASENSLVGWNRSMIIQNTYGYVLDKGTWNSPPTEPGLARVDVRPDGSGCRKVWQNDDVQVPSVLGKLSTPAGLFYTMTREDDANGLPSYFWAAIDVRTGAVAWRALAGTGSQWDSYVPALAIGPTGTLVIGLYGGLASLRDQAPRNGSD